MSTSVTEMMHELKELTIWQRTPEEITDSQYTKMIIDGIRKLYVMTNRPSAYSNDMFYEDGDAEEVEIFFKEDLPVNERYYVLLLAQIAFYKKVQADVNNIVGYTTNAISLTNADKPYVNLKDSIDALEKEARIIYYKMVDYTLGE